MSNHYKFKVQVLVGGGGQGTQQALANTTRTRADQRPLTSADPGVFYNRFSKGSQLIP